MMNEIVQNNKMISVAQKLWLNYVIAFESLMLATNLAVVSPSVVLLLCRMWILAFFSFEFSSPPPLKTCHQQVRSHCETILFAGLHHNNCASFPEN